MVSEDTTPNSTRDGSGETDVAATHAQAQLGVVFGLAAYGFWGLTPIFFKALTADYYGFFGTTFPGLEILAHRITWSLLFLVLLLTFRKQWGELGAAIRRRRTLMTLLVTTGLIGINWYLFIYAITTDRILEAALGYYINPLVNVFFGFVFLRERLRLLQVFALVVAVAGVLVMTFSALISGAGESGVVGIPWIALTLAFSFGFYGLLRKVAPVNGVPGLAFETMLLAPLAIGYLIYLGVSDGNVEAGEVVGHFGRVSLTADVFLVASGLVTIFPLLCFANAARRLKLSTLGFIQYLAPTENFVLGIFMFGEELSLWKLLAFGLIWVALGIYTFDTVRHNRGRVLRDG